MEKFSLERAQINATEIQEKAREKKSNRNESGEPSASDYNLADSEIDIEEKIKNLSLPNLLNSPTGKYDNLINRVGGDKIGHVSGLDANFSEVWKTYESEEYHDKADQNILNLLKSKLPENILCELGGASDRMEYFAAEYDADLYLNVDKYPNGNKKDESPIDPTIGTIEKRKYVDPLFGTEFIKGIHLTMGIRADMLDFISRLKDNSANIVINGIDADIIPVKEYQEALALEMLRAAKNDGVIFGNNSTSLNIAAELINNSKELSDKFEILKNEQGVVVIHKK